MNGITNYELRLKIEFLKGDHDNKLQSRISEEFTTSRLKEQHQSRYLQVGHTWEVSRPQQTTALTDLAMDNFSVALISDCLDEMLITYCHSHGNISQLEPTNRDVKKSNNTFHFENILIYKLYIKSHYIHLVKPQVIYLKISSRYYLHLERKRRNTRYRFRR